MEKKIYTYPGEELREEAFRINQEIYNELKERCIVLSEFEISKMSNMELENLKKVKTVISHPSSSGAGLWHYTILSNPENLTTQEMAHVCDQGLFNFGYSLEGNVISILTD